MAFEPISKLTAKRGPQNALTNSVSVISVNKSSVGFQISADVAASLGLSAGASRVSIHVGTDKDAGTIFIRLAKGGPDTRSVYKAGTTSKHVRFSAALSALGIRDPEKTTACQFELSDGGLYIDLPKSLLQAKAEAKPARRILINGRLQAAAA